MLARSPMGRKQGSYKREHSRNRRPDRSGLRPDPEVAASNGTASRAAYIKAKTDRDDVMAVAPVPVGPE